MSLTLHMHPLSSFCWKALVGLYENETPFVAKIVDLSNEAERNAFYSVWPIGKFPVLRDDARGVTVPESSLILEYLAQHYPGRAALIPRDPAQALEVRLLDRIIDLYLHIPMQKVVGDRMRAPGDKDPFGVREAQDRMKATYAVLEARIAGRTWAGGDAFTLADCAAAPALHYGNRVTPFADSHPALFAYLGRLEAHPSFARVLTEAAPYFKYFPG